MIMCVEEGIKDTASDFDILSNYFIRLIYCYWRPLLQAWLLPDIQYLTTVLGRILFSSVVMVLAFRPGIPCSNPVHTVFFCHAFVHMFLCCGLRL